MLVTTNDVNSLVTEIWSALFGRPIVAAPAASFDGRVIAATVRLRGDADSSVVVRCDPELASQMAGTMFNLDHSDLDSEDLQDTVGEIASIVAGNVKTLLGGDCELSIPVVTDGADTAIQPGERIVADDHFACDGGHLAVTSTRHST